jgi:hypothetical protein
MPAWLPTISGACWSRIREGAKWRTLRWTMTDAAAADWAAHYGRRIEKVPGSAEHRIGADTYVLKKGPQMHGGAAIFVTGRVRARTLSGGLPSLGKRK